MGETPIGIPPVLYVKWAGGSSILRAASRTCLPWKRLKGDFIVSARAEFIGPGAEAHRKIGWTARSPMDAGFATANNNAHVLSFDGKRLGISHYSVKDKGERAWVRRARIIGPGRDRVQRSRPDPMMPAA